MGVPAAKQGDQVVGVCTHTVMVPSPGGPVPTPLPHPFSGMLNNGLSTNVMISGWLIFLAMVFDGLDGYVARLSNTASDFGAQLDTDYILGMAKIKGAVKALLDIDRVIAADSAVVFQHAAGMRAAA